MSSVVDRLRCTHVTDVDAAGVDSSRRLVVVHGLVRLSLRLRSRLLLELNVSFVSPSAQEAVLTAFFSASISARRACISLSSCCQLTSAKTAYLIDVDVVEGRRGVSLLGHGVCIDGGFVVLWSLDVTVLPLETC